MDFKALQSRRYRDDLALISIKGYIVRDQREMYTYSSNGTRGALLAFMSNGVLFNSRI
uniref:Uncharacterized protein n=1 Tax=Octopus bimaculoides TaxID=37653 RepID=A0A0L8GV27_OCTBM